MDVLAPDETLSIPIDKIREPKHVLRLVNRNSVEFLELRDSIRERGLINSICVRPAKAAGQYEVVDGFYRFTCCQELGLREIPCIVKYNVTDQDVLALQLQANAIRPETKPIEFAKQIKKMMSLRPEISFVELAALLRKNPKWIRERLNLLELEKSIQLMVDRGEMPVQSAMMVAKIPKSLRNNYVDAARTLPANEFKLLAGGVIKQYAETIKQGRMDAFYHIEVKPQPNLRQLSHILTEIDRREAGPLILASEKCQSPVDAFYAGLRWAVHMDRQSVIELEERIRGRHRVKEQKALEADPLI